MYVNIGGWLVDLQQMPQETLLALTSSVQSQYEEAEAHLRLLIGERARREEAAEVLYLPGMNPNPAPA